MGLGIANNIDGRVQIRTSPARLNNQHVVIMTGSGAPTAGTTSSATGHGYAGRGTIYIDVAKPMLYISNGTNDSDHTWLEIGTNVGYFVA